MQHNYPKYLIWIENFGFLISAEAMIFGSYETEILVSIDTNIKHPDVTKPSTLAFIKNALDELIAKGYGLPVLVRNKYELRKAVAKIISDLRADRESANYADLFAAQADNFVTRVDHSLIFDAQGYAFNQPYAGATKFNKHYTPLIGDFKAAGEEFDYAVHLDRLDAVHYWIRNVENKRRSFSLQLPHGKFYPDFVALLKGGLILVVEYKGGHLYEAEQDKRQIGQVWAKASQGQCLFCMPRDHGFDLIDRTIGAGLGQPASYC